MLKFIENIGEFFSSNYFDEDFSKKVLEKSGHGAEERKEFQKRISALKDPYFKFKRTFLEDRLRTKDKVTETHRFHTLVLNALGYEGDRPQLRRALPPGREERAAHPPHPVSRYAVHMMVMEMQALIKEGDEDPDGLFEQQYNVEDESQLSPPQKYHRVQWQNVFTVPEGLKISPMVINKAVSELFLLDPHQRPRYILLCAGNQYYLLEQEKWFRGSYLRFDLEEVFTEAAIDRENYALFYFLLGKEALAPQAEIVLMDQLDEDSHKSAYEVTKDLKEGVVHAVEKLANETVFYWKQEGRDLADIDATKLKDDCLTMVYRLLFLFYAESRPDLELLPTKDKTYQDGYSLEMLRDLEQVPLNTASSINGHFFHLSITRLFHLMSSGYREKQEHSRSFRVRHLDSPLFDDAKLHYLKDVKVRNVVWQDVICQLSLSRQQRGKARGRISYANLGINQLGSVYESLLAFRGFFAEVDHIEVHRKRDGPRNLRAGGKQGRQLPGAAHPHRRFRSAGGLHGRAGREGAHHPPRHLHLPPQWARPAEERQLLHPRSAHRMHGEVHPEADPGTAGQGRDEGPRPAGPEDPGARHGRRRLPQRGHRPTGRSLPGLPPAGTETEGGAGQVPRGTAEDQGLHRHQQRVRRGLEPHGRGTGQAQPVAQRDPQGHADALLRLPPGLR